MKNKQQQSSGNDSLNIQAQSLQINTGISYSDAKMIAQEVFNKNFIQLTQQAKEIAEERAQELIFDFLEKLQIKNPLGVETFSDPDMQIVLFNAQRDYARNGKKELSDLLIDLLVKRTSFGEQELIKIVLNEALIVAPRITNKQLDALSLRFLIAYSRNTQITGLDEFNGYLKSQILPFCSNITTENSDYQHIEYLGCGSLSIAAHRFFDLMKNNYSGLFSLGFEIDEITRLNLTEEQKQKLIMPCIHDRKRYQISALNNEHIHALGKQLDLSDQIITELKHLHENCLMTPDNFKKMIINLHKEFEKFYEAWQQTFLSRLQLTSVGIALAIANIKHKIGIEIDLGIWIK